MSDNSNPQHGAEGGRHVCLFCATVYDCTMMHTESYSMVLPGARCCLDCRDANLRSAARWRRALYEPL